MMSLSQPIGVMPRAPFAMLALLSACGTGISFDPTPMGGRGVDGRSGGDGDDTDGGDVSIGGLAAEAGTDAGGPRESSSVSDAREDASLSPDRSDGGDAPFEVRVDVLGDAAVDAPGAKGDGMIDVEAEVAGEDGDSSDDVVPADDVRDGERDGRDALDAGDACTVGCPLETEYFVDANALPGGNGSKEAPFRTISAAIDAHTRAPGRARKAHVAAGIYDQALGEVFPLVLRGLSLEGAGPDQTSIVGSGTLSHAAEGGPKNLVYQVTLVAGDRALSTSVSGLSVRSVGPVPAQAFYGIFCDRGNATGEIASPAGRTQLDRVKIGPGFDTSVLATTSTVPSVTGCNMLITRSTITGAWTGVNAVGCDDWSTPGPVILEMGTADPASGNTLSWMQGSGGEGVLAESCVVQASFQYNSFSNSVTGVRVDEFRAGPNPSGPMHPFVFRHNRFEGMSFAGIVERGVLLYIEEISDNVFANNSRAANQPNVFAKGMYLQRNNVGKVRGNIVVGNDVGVSLDEGAESIDFGRPGDPGKNIFYCNSAIDGGSAGSDLEILNPKAPPDADAGPPKLLHFAGNSWDHAPPRVRSSSEAPNGVEISWTPPPGLDFDLTDSSLVTDNCPSGRIP